MKLATYNDHTVATRASLIAVLLLIITIFQGINALLSLVINLAPAFQPVPTLLWFVQYLVALVGLVVVHGLNWVTWLFRYRFLLVLLLMGTCASVMWSVESTVSFERTAHLLGSTLVAIYIGFMIPLNTIIMVFAWVLGIVLLMSVGAVFTLPEIGIEAYEGTKVWRGILTTKNTLGFWAAVGVFLYISLWSHSGSFGKKFFLLGMAALSLAVLYFSHSATALVALLVAGSISLYLFIAIRFQLGFVRMAITALLFLIIVSLAISNINTAELVGRSGDLTGRGEVWIQTWKLILQKPFLGYGYGSIWDPNDETIWIQQSLTDFTWVVYHAHNGFLQVASEIGLPLAGVAVLMIVQQLIEIFYCQYQRQQPGVLFVLAFVIAYLLSNYSEARFLVNRELYWIFFLALPISMLRQINVVMQSPEVIQSDFLNDEDMSNRYQPGLGGAALNSVQSEPNSEYVPVRKHELYLPVDNDHEQPNEITYNESLFNDKYEKELDETDFPEDSTNDQNVDLSNNAQNRTSFGNSDS